MTLNTIWRTRLFAGGLFLSALVATGSPAAQRGPRISETGTISGRIVTREGKPARGVRVAALDARAGDPATNPTAILSVLSLGETDAEGRYRLEDVPAGSYFVSAGLFDAATFFPGVSEQTQARVVTLETGAHPAAIDFRLTTVWFSGRLRREGPTETDHEIPPPIQAIHLQDSLNTFTALVGQDGAFTFPTLRPGEYRVMTTPMTATDSSLLSPIVVTLGDKDVTGFRLTLPAGLARLAGSVTVEEDAPLPRLNLRLIDTSSGPDPLSGQSPGDSIAAVQVKVAGAVTATVPAGIYNVMVTGLPKPFFVKSITNGATDLSVSGLRLTPSDVASIRIVLGVSGRFRWPSIRGRFSGRGALAGSAWPESAPAGFTPPPSPLTSSRSGSVSGPLVDRPAILRYLDGSFEIPRLVPGTYTLPNRITPSGEPRSDQVTVGNEDVENILIDVPAIRTTNAFAPVFAGAPAGPRVSGQIVGRSRIVTGEKYEVRLRSDGSEWYFAAPIHVDGSFEFDHVPPGTYTAEVSPPIPGSAPATFVVGDHDIQINVAVTATRDVLGRVTSSGTPLPRTMTFTVASQTLRVDVQAEGRFSIILPDGYAVGIVEDSLPAGFSAQSVTLKQTAGVPELRVALKTGPTVAVRGHVRADPAVLTGLSVSLIDADAALRATEAPVGNDGAFEFPSVLPGSYRMVILPRPGALFGEEVRIETTSGTDLEGLELIPVATNMPFAQ